MFDAKMLLDPFEEQLDLAAVFVERTDRGGQQGELVGQKHPASFRFLGPRWGAAEMNRIL